VKLARDDEGKAIRTLGATVHSAPIAQGYGTAGKHECAHRTMMILKHFDPSIYQWIVGDFTRYLDYWTPGYQHSVWLITGSPWQPGLIQVAQHLGAKAAPLIPGFRRCLDEKIAKDTKEKTHLECREKLQQGVRDFEAKHGR